MKSHFPSWVEAQDVKPFVVTDAGLFPTSIVSRSMGEVIGLDVSGYSIVLSGDHQNPQRGFPYAGKVPESTCPSLTRIHLVTFLNFLEFIILWPSLFLDNSWVELRRRKQTSIASPISILPAVCARWDMYAWRNQMVGCWIRLLKTSCIGTEKCFDGYTLVKDNLDWSLC